MNELELRTELEAISKEQLIEIFIKLKKIHIKVCERLDIFESESVAKTSLNELIDTL